MLVKSFFKKNIAYNRYQGVCCRMPYEDDILDYEVYDEDWENGMSEYYDFNLLDLLEETADALALADGTAYDMEHNPLCLEALENIRCRAFEN